MAPLFIAALIALLLAGGSGGEPDPPAPSASASGASAVDARFQPVRACELLSRAQAEAALGRIYPEPVKRRLAADNDACTYYKPSKKAAVTVALYPARSFDATVTALPRVKRDTVIRRPAAYDTRLGYLIELPGRPYYMQVTYSHVLHSHADRAASKRLAKDVLTGQTTPAARFICSLTGKRET